MIEPQMQGFYYQSPEEVSKIQALNMLNFALRKGKLMNFKEGIGSLPEKLASFFEVKRNCPILSINQDVDKKIILQSNSEKFYADRIVLATTATVAKSLFNSANELESSLLQTQYSSTINISITTEEHWKLPAYLNKVYGFLIPRRERQKIAAITMESNKTKENGQEHKWFNIMLDGIHGKQLMGMSDEEIMRSILPEIEKYFSGIGEFINFSHIIRWKEAEPIAFIGKSKKITEYQNSLDKQAKIILAGDYMGFPYTDSAAFTGKWCADFIKNSDN